jgi:hypothetical protein
MKTFLVLCFALSGCTTNITVHAKRASISLSPTVSVDAVPLPSL